MFGLTAYAEIITGQFLLSLGALFYTGWWLTAFRPDAREALINSQNRISYVFLSNAAS
jgi:hypothetical protein